MSASGPQRPFANGHASTSSAPPFERVPCCPRMRFSWPSLMLVWHSPSARDLLPLKAGNGLVALHEDGTADLRFDQVFRHERAHREPPRAWVDRLLLETAASTFGEPATLEPYHFNHPCAAAVLLDQPAQGDDGQGVVEVILLSPLKPASRPPLKARESSESVEAPIPGLLDRPMTAEEADDLLFKVTQKTYDPTKERKVLTEEELRSLVDDLPEIAFIASNQGQAVWFNKRWYEFTGLDHVDSMDPDKWRNQFHPDDLPTALAVWQQALLTATSFRFEYRVRGRDGLLRWMVCKGKPCWDEQGRLVHWVATIVDVEELVVARSEAVGMRDHINAILSSSRTIVLSVAPDLTVTFYEGSPHEVLVSPLAPGAARRGLPLAEAWPDAELVHAVRRHLDEGLDSSALQTSIVSEGRRYWYRYKLTTLLEESKAGQEGRRVKGVSAIGADVTEVAEAEERLRLAGIEKAKLMASETAAKEASRLKTEYFTHISHETRTPVAGIISIAELLLSDPSLQDEHRLLVSQALRSGEILLELVGMVLDLRKVESGELRLERMPFTLTDVMEDAKLFSVIARKKNLTFTEDIGPLHSGLLLGDRMRVRQVLANGLSNAAKFTDEGSVTLRARQVHETANKVHVQFTIIDTGCGISSEVLPTLFQPFRQADSSTARRYGGTGLGLVITRELVTLMGGRVELESEEGKGTTMVITMAFEKDKRSADQLEADRGLALNPLPVGATKSDRERAVAEVQRRRPPGTVRILVAEDNALLRELTSKTLRKMGFDVEAVEDGALAVQEVHRKRYDVVLMDGQMPVKDGYMATREIRADPDPQIAGLRIIALTASAFRGDRERCLEAGMSHYISKPVRAKDLEQAVWDQMADKEGLLAGVGASGAERGRTEDEAEEHCSMTPQSGSSERASRAGSERGGASPRVGEGRKGVNGGVGDVEAVAARMAGLRADGA